MKFVRAGSGRPPLLFHGLSNLRNWDPVFATLSRERDVLAVDLPGFGHSPPALARSKMGRSALLLQFSAHPWRLDPALVPQELQNFATSPSLDAAFHALVHGPKQQGAPRGSLKRSVVIGWGRNDRVTLPSPAWQAQELFPDAALRWFGNCGHFPHWDQPSDAVALILDATAPG